ncbi:Cyclopropane-fatty-acyl-phospholipid synthase [Pseudolycoriella hygida]|uniref:Cyclopropane-fatty-acyl-phospholipid synthase n=1 Tax=Pseudolycoriella hygida TaxID=35572 RepID=A0A9Q0MM48_9DIPT|nr:Cyclopropane-fatty-acyl-phospholipid synthase [Pseudolycoriella hygida]
MDIVMDILYKITLGAIRICRLLMRVIIFIAHRPIRAYAEWRMNKLGIGPGGTEPHNPVVHNDWVLNRMMCEGSLGLAESYIEGWWDCERLDVFFQKVFQAELYRELTYPWEKLIHYLKFKLFNLQTVTRAQEVIDTHYNLGNDLFESFLDKSMSYSCGYWKDAKTLEEAQEHKMELICRKLKLKPGMRVLDIGCGWGGLCEFLAVNYKVDVVGVNLSSEGAAAAKERCKGRSVEIRCQDYREINEGFDRIVTVGFLEHVGPKNYRSFFKLAHRTLSDDGILLIQTIGHDNDSIPQTELFLDKYIFRNGTLPNHKEIPKAIENLFCIEDWHNFGADYDLTLMAWHDNFVKNWPKISHKYENPNFSFRVWKYYFSLAAGGFRSRKFQLWQIVLTKGLPGGYISVR